jgi:chromatin remodeling complex protein RSC6
MAKSKSRKKRGKAESAKADVKELPSMIDDQPLRPSKELAAIIGNERVSFRRANRMLWNHIQRNGFQSRQDPRMIEITEKPGNQPLTDLLGQTSLSMFEMSAILREHLSGQID